MSVHLKPKRRVKSPRKAARKPRPSALVRLADQLAAALLRIASLETRVSELESANQRLGPGTWPPRRLPEDNRPWYEYPVPDYPGERPWPGKQPYQLPEITCGGKVAQ